MSHFILEKAQNALEELFECLFLVLHRVDEVVELFDVGFETVYANFLHSGNER